MSATVLATRQVPAGGSSAYTIHAVNFGASPYTVSETSGNVLLLVDSSGGNVVINLPTAVGNTAIIAVKKTVVANIVTTVPAGAETLEGGASAVLRMQGASIDIISNNTNWSII